MQSQTIVKDTITIRAPQAQHAEPTETQLTVLYTAAEHTRGYNVLAGYSARGPRSYAPYTPRLSLASARAPACEVSG